MSTSQRPGVIDVLTAYDSIGEYLENLVQAWLCQVTGLESSLVIPDYTERKTITPNADLAIFRINPGQDYGATYECTGESSTICYHGTLEVKLSIYGPHCRHIAQLVRMQSRIAQTLNVLPVCLGLISADVTAYLQEPYGANYLQRADVTLTFNHTQTAEVAVKSFLKAAVQITR